MIAYLQGEVKYKSAFSKKDNFVILAAAGVGYKVFLLNQLLNQIKIGQELEIYVHTQVAEGVLDLYGFAALEELQFFEILISLPGIGPRSAIDILQKAKIADLKKAAQAGNADLLSKVSGIGPKTAQKVVQGLRDKLAEEIGAEDWSREFGEALEALTGLGYPMAQAREALNHCQASETGEKIKEALKILGGRKK